jgi:hypothetical protein
MYVCGDLSQLTTLLCPIPYKDSGPRRVVCPSGTPGRCRWPDCPSQLRFPFPVNYPSLSQSTMLPCPNQLSFPVPVNYASLSHPSGRRQAPQECMPSGTPGRWPGCPLPYFFPHEKVGLRQDVRLLGPQVGKRALPVAAIPCSIAYEDIVGTPPGCTSSRPQDR